MHADGSIEFIRQNKADLWVLHSSATNILRGSSVLFDPHGKVIRGIPGVKSVSPVLLLLSAVKKGSLTATVFLTGFDPAAGLGGQEGDLIAYRKDKWEARKNIFQKAQINQIGYRLFKYGHLAIAIRESDDGNTLRLLSSQALKGPNIREDIATLKNYSWDVYRLIRWDRVDKKRFYEFGNLVRQKAERWCRHDFPGVFGLWNSNLRPIQPQDICRTYSCSTVILAALYYAGLELDAFHRSGIGDIITPLQIVRSKGRIVPLPEIAMQASSGEMEGKVGTLYAFQRWD